MKPDDANGTRDARSRPFRVLVIAGSDRRQYNCPGVDSKARTLMLRMADRLPQEWEIDLEDLGNVYGRAHIQSCNACVSTSMALCVWPCNCYERGSKDEPDLMWDLDLYARLDLADAWAIIGPVNWYGPSSNLKAMFDRLVCMNGGNPREELIEHKNPELAMQLEHRPEWKDLSRNHLEGRLAADRRFHPAGHDQREGRARALSGLRVRPAEPSMGRSETEVERTAHGDGCAAWRFVPGRTAGARPESRRHAAPLSKRSREPKRLVSSV
ncbi:MAG: NAD(P)H-dependent oxidoreductase [Acidobacteria bacterium]|nr:NAD(P)H-dependent oxidoreductase [Acidobacteriota bacterium]